MLIPGVIPMPMRPFTPTLPFVELRGVEGPYFNKAAHEEKKMKDHINYVKSLEYSYQCLLDRDEVDDEVDEVYRAEFAWARARLS